MLSLAENPGKNLRYKCSQKLLGDTLKSAKEAFQIASIGKIVQTGWATDDLICDRITNKITNITSQSGSSNQNLLT